MRTIDFQSECVLLDHDNDQQANLVRIYNELMEFLQSLPEGLLDFLITFSTNGRSRVSTGAEGARGLQPVAGNLEQQIRAVTDSLTRSRYRIGFVGRSQLGKSSAVNQMLNCKILKEAGGGRACTSVVTVIEAHDAQQKFNFFARYYTKEELQRRFEGVAGRLTGCPVALLPNDFQVLPQVRKQLLDWAKQMPVGDPEELNPGEYLAAMVDQAHRGQAKLGMDGEDVECEDQADLYNKLENLVAYRPGQATTGEDRFFPLLVKEFVVQMLMPGFGKITMIDLPGLGTFHSADSELTKEYVRSLDGLLLFVRPNSLDNEELKELSDIFRKQHVASKGRTWFIIAAFDGLDPQDRDGPFFQSLGSVIRTLDIRPDWVRFFSAYCMIRGKVDTDKVSTRTLAKDKEKLAEGLRLRFDGTDLVLPNAPRKDFEPFESAFFSYMDDGGYAELRVVMGTHIATTVRQAVCEEATKKLADIIRLIERGIDAAAHGGLDEENQAIADAWATVFVAIPNELLPGKFKADLSRIAGQLFADLWRQSEESASMESINLVRQANHDLQKKDDHPWVMLHRTMTREMARIVRRGTPEMEKQYFELIKTRIETVAQAKKQLSDNGTLRFPQGISPTVELSNLFNESNLQKDLENDLKVLQDASVIQNRKTRQIYSYISASDYRLIMQRKVESLCYTHLARMRRHMLKCCNEVQYELYRRADPKLQPSKLDRAEHQALRSSLASLLQRLTQLTFTSN